MPFPLILVFAGLGLAAAAAVVFWHEILDWAETSLLPWFERHLPALAGYVREAFVQVDKVVSAVRRTAAAAWEKIRPHLLQQLVEIERNTSSELVRRVTAFLVKNLQKKEVVKVVTEEVVNRDHLPDDVRAALLRRGSYQVDVTAHREQELELAS